MKCWGCSFDAKRSPLRRSSPNPKRRVGEEDKPTRTRREGEDSCDTRAATSPQCAPAALCLTPLGLHRTPSSPVLVTLVGTYSPPPVWRARPGLLLRRRHVGPPTARCGARPLLQRQRAWPGPLLQRRPARLAPSAKARSTEARGGSRGSWIQKTARADPVMSGYNTQIQRAAVGVARLWARQASWVGSTGLIDGLIVSYFFNLLTETDICL